jgi:hypothetical protein
MHSGLCEVNALHAAVRMFEQRDRVHTLLYNYAWKPGVILTVPRSG